jgi:hypothetical protein
MGCRLPILGLLFVLTGAAGCHDGSSEPETYTASLTDMQLQAKGSNGSIPVNDLPVHGATITHE